MKKIAILIVGILVSNILFAQKSEHRITVTAPQLANETMLLAYHYGKKQYISDTFQFDKKGKLVMEGEEPMHHGVYLAVFPKFGNRYFEFLVKGQFFDITLADTSQLNKPTFKNSPDNDLFYADMNKMADIRKQSQELEAKIKSSQGAEKEKYETDLKKLNNDFISYREKLMDTNKNLFYADLLGMMREIDLPDAPESMTDDEKNNFRFEYFRKHYWDYTNFAEEGIIRTPIFEGKLADYFDKYTVKLQDSVIVACDYVLKKAAQNDKVFQYVLVTLLNKYANSKVMGDDAVYVHLVNNYYSTDKAWWADEETVNKMKERAGALEPILIGKISPDLNLRDTTVTNFVRLHSVKSDYTIIFIWDPDCGHCKKAAPVLKKFYDKHKNDGIKVYAITTVSIEELDKWKKFIRENDLNFINVGDLYHQTKFRDLYDISSTPQIFILDSKKEIIAKRLGVEQLENFFHQYLKIKDDARYNNFEFKKVEPLEEGHNEHDGHGH